jgi:presenilin-like A22 family membrane protease
MEGDSLPVQEEKSSASEILKAVGLFLVAVILPLFLDATFTYFSNPLHYSEGDPYFPFVIGLAALLNAATLFLSIRLGQKQSKIFKTMAVILIILSIAYFIVLFLLWYAFAVFG